MLVRLLKRILLEKIFCTLIESQLITIDCNYNWNEVNKCTKNVHLRERERERDEGSGIRDKEMGIRMKVDGRSGILYFPSAISLILACKQRPRETTTPPSPPNLSTSARHRNFVPFPVFPAVFLSLPSPPPLPLSPRAKLYPAKQQEKLKWMQTSIEGGRGILLLTQDLYF